MSNVGLLFVGAVLFVNGLGLLGLVTARGGAPLNLFVGTLQVVLPTIALVQAPDLATAASWAPIYLFGFTYLYVGINALAGLDGTGLGWFSSFVAVMAVVQAVLSIEDDLAFTAIWLTWAVMWLLFFLVLALGRDELTRFAGWVLVLGSHLTCTVPALLGLHGNWPTSTGFGVLALVLAVAVVGLAAVLARTAPAATVPAPRPAA